MQQKLFLLFALILIISCQNNSNKPSKFDSVKKSSNIETNSSQKKIESKINLTDKQIYKPIDVATLPKYPDGMQKFYAFLRKNYVMPEEVIKDEGLASAIFASFIIEKDGTISDIKILNDFGYG